eukprot:CAMPEP_0173380024 /NCGR_PEP_ID=MMETSP1356-20130122/2795_1 /TAXON_ID=77927 ORGANISM="Hemiselmis virescens, Strain PCC157" /NCGR_SAMPLE_ID=MMETSP1356 /ASSEMBLY_ACC=CAM_ASM_000847 /LENGTH=60 /DNA_ID=CAMNT_0014333497 /DNA_START=204 /DNA_END=386 /DNA_ORIENTATION=+
MIKREFATVAKEAPKAASNIGSYLMLAGPGAVGLAMGWKASSDLKNTSVFSNDDTISYMW